MPIRPIASLDIVRPDAALVTSVLAATYPSINGMNIIMQPEGDGELFAASIEQGAVSGMEEALLALWKITFCIENDWPYEPWGIKKAKSVNDTYFSRCHHVWSEKTCRSPTEFLGGLKSLARRVAEKYLERREPIERTCFVPNQAAVIQAELHKLDCLTSKALRVVLSDEWNFYQGLFEAGDRWFLVSWETSA